MLLLLRPLFPFIVKVGLFKRWIKDHCGKVIGALVFYFIKIFTNLLDNYINTQFKKGVAFIFKALCYAVRYLVPTNISNWAGI